MFLKDKNKKRDIDNFHSRFYFLQEKEVKYEFFRFKCGKKN